MSPRDATRAAREAGRAVAGALSGAGRKVRFVGARPFGDALVLSTFKLGNGLTVHALPDPIAPVVSVHTWFGIGSRDESPGKTGQAHLLEHLMFGATERRALGEFDRLLEEAGAEVNAATWTDWTQYYENAPKAALPLVLDLESDRMDGLVLEDAQVASEKEVVANERRMCAEDDPDGMLDEALFRAVFKEHGYRSPTIGEMPDILGFTAADCMGFYRRWYAPNRARLVVTGDFDLGETMAAIDGHYGDKKRHRGGARSTLVEPAQRRERRRRLSIQSQQEKLRLGYRAPASGTPEHVALEVATEVLFGGRSARMDRALVHEGNVCTDITGGVTPFEHPGVFIVGMDVRPGKTGDDALAQFDAILDRFVTEGPTEDEVLRARHQLELSLYGALETAGGKAERVGFDATVHGDPTYVFSHLARLRSITPAMVHAVARDVLRRGRRSVIFGRPR